MAENQNSNRKNENVRRANRIIQTRSFVLMILMGVVMFVLLFFRLFDLQITRHEELQGKAVNQQTRRTVVTANRGTIYDAGGNILAISSSAETIILSPLEIDNAVNDTEDPVSWTKESLAAGLAEILGKDASARSGRRLSSGRRCASTASGTKPFCGATRRPPATSSSMCRTADSSMTA